ncbi:MAG: hypothetical protein U0Q22_11030 [Acidimicrobiales bacterium]
MASRGAQPRLRSKESAPSRGRSRSSRRAALLAGNSARIVALIAVVIGSGAVAGMALGYPLRTLDLGGSDAVTLDQEALSGTIDAEQALVTLDDLPKSYAVAPDTVVAGVSLIGANYCGGTVAPGDQVGDRLAQAFVDSKNNSLVLAEVVKVRRQNDAGKYVREMISLFDGCDNGRFFKVEGENRTEVKISDDRRDQPLAADYVSRTLTPVKGGTIQIVTYFQVGNVIVAIQYAGPANPPKTLMRNAELAVLYRVAPDQLSKTAKVKGAKPLPEETTTTVTDAVQPSPTSSPPTVAPPPTFEPPTTTRPTGKKKTTATTAPTQQQAVTTAPGQ